MTIFIKFISQSNQYISWPSHWLKRIQIID